VVAGVDFVYDYEIASLRGLSGALSASDRMKLQEQQWRSASGVRMVGRHLRGSADELDDNRAGGQDREYPCLVATNAVGV